MTENESKLQILPPETFQGVQLNTDELARGLYAKQSKQEQELREMMTTSPTKEELAALLTATRTERVSMTYLERVGRRDPNELRQLASQLAEEELANLSVKTSATEPSILSTALPKEHIVSPPQTAPHSAPEIDINEKAAELREKFGKAATYTLAGPIVGLVSAGEWVGKRVVEKVQERILPPDETCILYDVRHRSLEKELRNNPNFQAAAAKAVYEATGR